MPAPRKLTLREASERTGFPQTVIRTAVANRALPAYIPPGLQRQRMYFTEADLDAWAAASAPASAKGGVTTAAKAV